MPPLFHHPSLTDSDRIIPLEPDTARHIVQVLRMQAGEPIRLTNGRGLLAEAAIHEAGKKQCSVAISGITTQEDTRLLHLAVAFTKNTSRNEWLLEKAAELGVKRIIPLQSERGNRERIKEERWRQILISAMLQSEQCYLAGLAQPMPLGKLVTETIPAKLLAHCLSEHPRTPLSQAIEANKETLILIGPEGDFSLEEVILAEAQGCKSISLGATRLRTETAALAACALFHLSS